MIRLRTINGWMRRLGVVIVLEIPDTPDGWIRVGLARASRHPLV